MTSRMMKVGEKDVMLDLDVNAVTDTAVAYIYVDGTLLAEVTEPLPDCSEDHCDHDSWPMATPGLRSAVAEELGAVYHRLAPERERNCDWWRSMDEPWRSIADALGVR